MSDRKFDNENDRQCVIMLWQKCLPQQFTRYIFLYDNFLALTQMEITYQKANKAVRQFLTEHPIEKSLADLAYTEQIFNIENKPQLAKDPNNYNKLERNINEFKQVPINEKESSPPLQKFFLLPQKYNNNKKKKNIETNKAKEQMNL